ncbi:P-type conjugative transfer protein TrbJ [Oxalobacteraceae bacterium A2-2]
MPPRRTARKIAMLCALSLLSAAPTRAALPVIDGSNLSQNVVTALEQVAQTLKQIQQYQTQLQQYENMLQNTLAPVTNIWDAASTTMNQLRGSIDTLNYFKTTLGSVDSYLGKFRDTSYYRSSPCFSVNGCSAAEWAALSESERIGSVAQKRANDALFKGLDRQLSAMETDAARLQQLQSAARSSSGQLQAIGYANQLASHSANQLLQIRALLIAQQNAITTRDQVLADREAKEAAFSATFRASRYKKSADKKW